MSITDAFKESMIEKRGKFSERVHAAFVLNTSLNHWGEISENDMSWLRRAYPNSIIEKGKDQGASYTTITPQF